MDNTIDLLQIKIEKAKTQLPESTLAAINAVPWQATILQMRETKRYTFEQLEDLETETELLLCGLLNPQNYPIELENRMRLSKIEVNELVKEMNNLVFSKIKEELIKNTEKKETSVEKEEKNDTQILRSAGIEILNGNNKEPLPVLEKLELSSSPRLVEEGAGGGDLKEKHPILAQKLSGFTQEGVVETHHSLENITKGTETSETTTKIPRIDPYRETPE